MSLRGAILKLLSGAFTLTITTNNLTVDRALALKGNWTAGQIPRINSADASILEWVDPGTLGGGTVSSVSIGANATAVLDIATGSSTPVITFDNQAANLVFAGPVADGPAGTPTFRALVAADIPNHSTDKLTSGTLAFGRLPVGTAANTVAAGNDPRFHSPNTDTGTTATSFAINSGGATGFRLKDEAGAMAVRNPADSAYADLIIRNLIVQGTQTTINSETVTISDNTLVLNSDFAGATPTESGGIEVERGTQTNASLIWDEGADRWKMGLAGAEFLIPIKKVFPFTQASLTGGQLVINHGLKDRDVTYTVWDGNNEALSPGAIASSIDELTLNFGSATIPGNARVVVQG